MSSRVPSGVDSVTVKTVDLTTGLVTWRARLRLIAVSSRESEKKEK